MYVHFQNRAKGINPNEMYDLVKKALYTIINPLNRVLKFMEILLSSFATVITVALLLQQLLELAAKHVNSVTICVISLKD